MEDGWEALSSDVEWFRAGDGLYEVNPWRLEHRRTAVKVLMAAFATRQPQVDAGGAGNPLWGIELQTSWQNRTGRHMRPPGGDIDPSAWWAAGNYVLTMEPLLAAVSAGLLELPDEAVLRLAPPPQGAATG